MSAIWKRLEEKEEGFTLIELLVVVIIIGILAAIAIPVFLNQRESAWRSSVESDIRNAAIEVETFYTAGQVYPATAVLDTTTTPAVGISTGTVDAADGVAGTDDGIQYQLRGDGQSYCLWAWHANISETGDPPVASYDSAAGGIQATPASGCT